MDFPSLLIWFALAVAPGPDGVDEAIAVAQGYAAAGDFDRALATVREERKRSDDPALVFVEAQLLRLNGDCLTALARYQEFLASGPPAEDRIAAETNVKACEQELPRTEPKPAPVLPAPEPSPETTPVAPEPATVEPHDNPDAPAKRDAVGIALWTSGGVLLATGAGLYGGAWAQRSNSDRGSPNLDEYLANERQARTLSGIGIAAMSVGAGVLITALVRHVLTRRGGRARQTAVLSSLGRTRDIRR
ncbi:MAG: hypothetical protein JKY37_00330 [Nannocystaceae bacterium]|nr:hypothetical protein [Nannocystaceae bacterium]